jgi:hypothetical protein
VRADLVTLLTGGNGGPRARAPDLEAGAEQAAEVRHYNRTPASGDPAACVTASQIGVSLDHSNDGGSGGATQKPPRGAHRAAPRYGTAASARPRR